MRTRTTVRVVKAREPFQKKLDVDFDRYFLIRQDAEFAAIRLVRRTGGGATWDCSYQGDGSGEMVRGQRAHGELFEKLTPIEPAAGAPAGVSSMAGSQLNVNCGPLVIGWSPGNWVYPRGLWTGDDQARHEHDRGVDVATTTARDLAEVDVFDADLDWLSPW